MNSRRNLLQLGTGWFLAHNSQAQQRGETQLREVEVSLADFMTAGQLENARVGTGNPDTDRACLQAAWNALPEHGGKLKLPAGTFMLDATRLDFRNKSNWTMEGAGMGVTTINGAAVGGGSPNCVILMGNTSGQPGRLKDVTLRDFSICGSGTSRTGNIVNFRGIDRVTFERLEVYQGFREVIYCDGAYPAFSGLTVRSCHFHDNFGHLSSCINTNTTGVSDILVEGNRFERVSTGMYILGRNARVVNNTFVDVNCGVAFAESNFAETESFSSFVIANNTFHGLGRNLVPFGGYPFTESNGILQNAKARGYNNNGADSGAVIANNTFKESYADLALRCITIRTGALVIGNYCSGLRSTNSTTQIFIDAKFSSDGPNPYHGSNRTPTHLYLRDNVLEKKPAGSNFAFGLFVRASQNAHLHLSGNHLDAVITGAQFYESASGFLPFVSCNGDVIAPTMRLYDLAGSDAGIGTSGEPLYGSNATTFRTANSPDLLSGLRSRNLGGSSRPDVSKGVWFHCANQVPITIIDFVNAPPHVREITIWFNDANTTVQHGTSLRLNGGANFISSPGASLTLCRPNHMGPAWHERCRSKP